MSAEPPKRGKRVHEHRPHVQSLRRSAPRMRFASGLHERRRLGQFVQEEHAGTTAGQEGRRAPDRGLAVEPGQAAQVDRVEAAVRPQHVRDAGAAGDPVRDLGQQVEDAVQDEQVGLPHDRGGRPGPEVARRDRLTNRVPDVPGGGTVEYVNPAEHVYLHDPIAREEGGTPAIIEAIRAGLVFGLKQVVGVDLIRAKEEEFLRRAVRAWTAEPAIQMLAAICTTTSSYRCSMTCSGSRHAAAAPAPARTATNFWASTSTDHTHSNAKSPKAARASSPAGCE